MSIEQSIVRQAVEQFGEHKQKLKAISELAELIDALAKNAIDGRSNDDDVIDEMVDAQIMLWQLKTMYCNDKFCERLQFKLERLKKMVDQAKELTDSAMVR
ncbi:hypothetical protein AB6E53_02395 [Vibrio breoganii]|uniref:NTP pyrophosphohydrolase MazG putative catalytic core domain-containing protein n=1 Tax=Vibrio breoganii TaxID=553239 RepID=A0AAP8SWI4_9VIBR|nr:hypothetical protein [Vibrio breoganii]PMP10238.1 hypothetical protein BCS93_11220 [Vibrio breoganii]